MAYLQLTSNFAMKRVANRGGIGPASGSSITRFSVICQPDWIYDRHSVYERAIQSVK